MQSEREEIANRYKKCLSHHSLTRDKIIDFVLREKSQSFAEGKKQGLTEACDKILLDLTIADIGTPPKISNVDDRIKIRQCVANLKFHAEQSLGEGK